MNKLFSYIFFLCCATVLFSCQKEVSEENNTSIAAEGSLWDSTGNCLPDSVYGTFYGGITPGSDTAYVQVQVNVTQTGSYSIISEQEDGFYFADSGFFSSAGLNIIRLKPVGTPIIPTTSTFTISFDSSSCSFNVTIKDSTGTGLGGNQDTTGTGGNVQSGQWQFTEASFVYAGSIDSATKDNSTGLATFIHVGGATSTGDTTMSLDFSILASDIQPGTYTILNNTILFSVIDGTSLTVLYNADAFTAGTDLTIIITSYDAVTKEMKGTFSGNVQTNSGSIVPIANGSLDVIFP